MRNFLLTCTLICCFVSVKAQNQNDTITIEKGFGTVYTFQGERLSPKQMLNLMESNRAAYDIMKKAKRNNDIGQVFGFAGGFLIGFPLGAAIAGGDPNWLLAGIGAGLVGVSVPFTVFYNKNARKAVAIYNDGVKSLGYYPMEMRLGFAANGVGLTLKF